jgi:hypothetical protein
MKENLNLKKLKKILKISILKISVSKISIIKIHLKNTEVSRKKQKIEILLDKVEDYTKATVELAILSVIGISTKSFFTSIRIKN